MTEENDTEPKTVQSARMAEARRRGRRHRCAAAERRGRGRLHGRHASSAPKPASPADEPVPVYEFLNGDEAAFIEAAVDTFIPTDDVGPGALELGVAVFIDRQLNSGYGRGDRMYLQGPFIEGTPEQGYQLRMTPSELVRNGILDLNAYLRDKFKRTFDALSKRIALPC